LEKKSVFVLDGRTVVLMSANTSVQIRCLK